MVRPQRGRKREGDSSAASKMYGGKNNGSKRTSFGKAEPYRKDQHEREGQLRMLRSGQ